MADSLKFPITFDLEAAVKGAEKDIDGVLRRIEIAIKSKPVEVKIDTQGFEQLGQSMNKLTAHLATLNNMLSATGRESVDAQQEVTQSIEEQGRVVANTTNTVSRQLMAQERVNKTLRETYAEQERVNRLISQYHDTYEGQIATLAKLNSQLALNKKAQSDNEKALKDNSITTEQYAKRNAELLAQYRQLTQEKRILSQIMTAEEKAMLAQEGSYVQLSQQLSLLKKAYKELGDEGRTSLFGQDLEGAIQNLDARLKDMAADMGEFQRNVGNYAIAGQNGVVTTESLTAAINQEARTTQDLIDQTRILEEAKRMLNTTDTNYASTLETINAKLEENKRKLSDISDILGRDAKSVAEAEAQNKRLSEALKLVDLTSADAKKRLEEIRTQIERNNKTIAAATGANEKYAESLLGLVGVNANFGTSLQSLGSGGNFIDGLKTKVQAFGKTLMGLLSNPVVLGFLGVAGVVAGFKWWYDYNKGLIEASRLTENFTGLSGEAADKVTADMQALADHMGQGYDKTISAANALVQQFGVSWEEAMKLMQDGIVAGADMSGNMVSNIERFAPALRDAGVSADEFMSILAETRNGIFNEQGIQLIVRAGGRLKAMTKQMAESLDAAGISSKQLQKDLSDGTITMFDAVQKVATKLKELPENSQEAGNIMKHVFGRTAAEGGTLLIQSIADVNTNLDEAKNRMEELGKANEAQINAQKELNEALSAVFKMSGTNFEVMIINAKTFIIQGITKIIKGCVDIVNWFINIYNEAIYVHIGVANIVVTFKTLWTVAKGLFEFLINGFEGIGGVMEGVALILSGEIKSGASKIKDAFANGFKGIKDIAIKSGKEIGANFADEFKDVAKRKLNKVSAKLDADISGGGKNGKDGKNEDVVPIGDKGDKEAAKTYLQTLNKIEQSLSSIYSKYGDLEKKEGATKALGHINELYKTQLTYINELGKQFGLSFKMPTSFKDLQSYRSAILDVINKLKASGIKGADSAALDLEMKIGLGNVSEQSKQIEAELKQLADRISRTKTAKEFYEKILSTTGDHSLASKVAESIFGQNGSTLQKALADQVRGMTNEIELPEGIISAGNIIDYKALRVFAEANKKELGGMYDELVKISEQGQKDLAKTYEGYLKDLEKAKAYSDKRIELARYTANQIAEIEKSTLPKDEKERLTAGYREREDKEAAKLEYEAFKNSALYVQMFEDLDYASTSALTRMRDRLIALKSQWKNLSPTELKELQSRLKEIDEQAASRNPFKALADAWKKWQDLRKSGRTKEGDELNADAAEKARQEAEKKMLADERAYEAVQKAADAASEEEKPALQAAADAARKVADESKAAYDNAENISNEAADLANEWKTIGQLIANANQKIDEYQSKINEALDGVRKMMEAFGASDEDMQFFDDVVGALNEIVDAGQQATMSVASFMSGNILGGITSGVSAIGGLVSGFTNLFSAGKVRKANKEIERQQELLEQLEYTYGRLEKAADKAFGTDYVNNYQQQIKNLQAQQAAYLKQAEAERSKGKKKDKDKIKEYENQARDTANAIKDLQDDLVAHFTGSSRTDVARQMAKSWIDARASMSDTFAAIKEDYAEMIKNMIVEGAAARVIENALTPMWDSMEKMLAKNDVEGAIDSLVNGMDDALTQANNGMEVLWKALEARGYDMKQLIGDVDSEYTGIAKNIAGATSEEINTAAAIGNTIMYHTSHLPIISQNVAAIYEFMSQGKSSAIPDSGTAGWTDWQQQAMENYNAIARNTADTVVRCERAAVACEAMAEKMGRIIVAKGGKFAVNTTYV